MSVLAIWFWISAVGSIVGLLVRCIGFVGTSKGNKSNFLSVAVGTFLMAIFMNATWILGAIWFVLYCIKLAKV